jgi:hypothetical protein
MQNAAAPSLSEHYEELGRFVVCFMDPRLAAPYGLLAISRYQC